MRNVVLLGTGGCASELTFYIDHHNTFMDQNKRINIVGYLDFEDRMEHHYDKYNFKAPIIGNIYSYEPKPNEEVLIAVGDIKFREEAIAEFEKRSVPIGSFIHYSSIISPNSIIGKGTIIFPFCIIEDYVKIGDFNLMTAYSFISHDCTVGNNNFLSVAGLAGNVRVGNNNYFGVRSTVIPGKKIGNNNVVQAGMTVDQNIKDDTTVFYRYKEKVLAIPKAISSDRV